MSGKTPVDRHLLENKLERAFDEAWSKVNTALTETPGSTVGFATSLWLAAEAVEYTSLLFNLNYGLEDLEPVVKNRKGEDPLVLIKDSMGLLRRAREGRQ